MNIYIKGGVSMELAKEKWYEVKYNTKTKEMSLKKIILKEKIYLAKIKRAIKKHKFITTVSLAFIVFSSLNIIMIYNFFEILQNT